MVRCLMKGKNPAKKYAGYSEHLTIQSTLPSRTSLMAYSPTQLATATTYNVGFQASSDKTVGIRTVGIEKFSRKHCKTDTASYNCFLPLI